MNNSSVRTFAPLLSQGQLAVLALIAAGTLWGGSLLLGKLAMAELGVGHVVLYRFVLTLLVLLPVTLARREWPRRRDVPLFVLTGFLTVPATYLLQFAGLALTSVASAALIVGALPLFIALGASWFTAEKLGLTGWTAVALSTLGVGLIVGQPDGQHNWLGDGLIVLSSIVVAGWVLLSKRLLQRYSALAATTYILSFGTLTLLPIALAWDGLPRVDLSAGAWAAVLGLGLGCTALTNIFWNWGLKYVPASQAGIYQNLEPLIGSALGVVVLGEALGAGAIAGGLLIITAAVVISRQKGAEA